MNIKKILTESIKNRSKIKIIYKQEPKNRTVYPHVLYTNTKEHLILDAYQVEGYSSSHSIFPMWKMFLVQDISDIEVLEDTFTPITSYNAESIRYKNSIEKI